MLTVLFVDDDPNVLAAIRRSTRRRTDWDTHFVDSGVDALALCESVGRVDVLVTDMRMPGMDGAELLKQVRARSPLTARVVLSGQSDHDAVFRAVGPAHQYLAKPTDFDELARVIELVTTPPGRPLDDRALRMVGRADVLQSPPALVEQVVRAMEMPSSNYREIARLVSEDVALTAEVMKLVNSAFFGHYGRVDTVEAAIALLGMDMLRALMLEHDLFGRRHLGAQWLDLTSLARRSRALAQAARGLALRNDCDHATAGQAFLAGMVSEIGLLVMADVPIADPEICSRLGFAWDPELERSVFGGDRYSVGCHLLNLWGFAEPIVEAVALRGTRGVGSEGTVGWYTGAAWRLIHEAGVDALELADPKAVLPGVDRALAASRWVEAVRR